MIVTIHIPDALPAERVQQRIKEIEQSLLAEASFWEKTKPGTEPPSAETEANLFLSSFGSWQDDRDAGTQIKEIYAARQPSERSATL